MSDNINVIAAPSSMGTEEDDSYECYREAVGGLVNFSSENETATGMMTSASNAPTVSFCRNALKASLILSALGTAATSTVDSIENIILKISELSVKYENIYCLTENILKFGEKDLISHGINIRPELEKFGINPEDRKLTQDTIDRLYIAAQAETNVTEAIAEVEDKCDSVVAVVLDACEKIKNIADFDSNARNRLGSISDIVTLNDTLHRDCPDIHTGTPKDNSVARPTVKVVFIVVIVSVLLLLIMLVVREAKKFGQLDCSGANRRGNNDTDLLLMENMDYENPDDFTFLDDFSSINGRDYLDNFPSTSATSTLLGMVSSIHEEPVGESSTHHRSSNLLPLLTDSESDIDD
ncbi:hypothetical protein [Candidatus Ichthyocystis hellenicum]|uniref:hypothetical protein n=1 Tax=Candidatus Ichthyocystis hellenicum TaxID=1561003 RepID=UPI000B813ABF|nr:hypothetical protein [Candidatus Ichthyocystis hellenicum]